MKTKTCIKCKSEKAIEFFNRNGKSYRTDCKECQATSDRLRRKSKKPDIIFHKTKSDIVYDDGTFCMIDVSTNKYPRAVMLVDSEDKELFTGRVWSASERNGTIYARSSLNGTTISAHRLVRPEFKMIDHANHNGLDNRKANLRNTNHKLNARNRRLSNGSVYNGVNWNRFKGKFQVTIGVDGKNIRLGLFDDLSEALNARLKGEREYWHEKEIK